MFSLSYEDRYERVLEDIARLMQELTREHAFIEEERARIAELIAKVKAVGGS